MDANETTRRVLKALRDGWSWDEIGQKLGLTAAQAERQYGKVLEQAAPVSTWTSAAYRPDAS